MRVSRSDGELYVRVCLGLMESMKAADQNNWSMNPEQFADLAASLRNFFTKTGINQSSLDIQPQYPLASNDNVTCKYNIYWYQSCVVILSEVAGSNKHDRSFINDAYVVFLHHGSSVLNTSMFIKTYN